MTQSLALTAVQKAKVDNAASILKADYRTRWTVTRLAAAVVLPPRVLSVAFKQEYGVTVQTMLSNVRHEHAVSLLLAGMSVTEVAKTCGFCTAGAFGVQFHRRMGIFASHYRFKMMPHTPVAAQKSRHASV